MHWPRHRNEYITLSLILVGFCNFISSASSPGVRTKLKLHSSSHNNLINFCNHTVWRGTSIQMIRSNKQGTHIRSDYWDCSTPEPRSQRRLLRSRRQLHPAPWTGWSWAPPTDTTSTWPMWPCNHDLHVILIVPIRVVTILPFNCQLFIAVHIYRGRCRLARSLRGLWFPHAYPVCFTPLCFSCICESVKCDNVRQNFRSCGGSASSSWINSYTLDPNEDSILQNIHHLSHILMSW